MAEARGCHAAPNLRIEQQSPGKPHGTLNDQLRPTAFSHTPETKTRKTRENPAHPVITVWISKPGGICHHPCLAPLRKASDADRL